MPDYLLLITAALAPVADFATTVKYGTREVGVLGAGLARRLGLERAAGLLMVLGWGLVAVAAWLGSAWLLGFLAGAFSASALGNYLRRRR